MTMCTVENCGQYSLHVELEDGSWREVAAGKTMTVGLGIKRIDHGPRRANYRVDCRGSDGEQAASASMRIISNGRLRFALD